MYYDPQSYAVAILPSSIRLATPAARTKDARGYLDQAFTYFFAGNYDRAEADCRLAMSCECSDPNALASLVRILSMTATE
jgi:hypothetical protein